MWRAARTGEPMQPPTKATHPSSLEDTLQQQQQQRHPTITSSSYAHGGGVGGGGSGSADPQPLPPLPSDLPLPAEFDAGARFERFDRWGHTHSPLLGYLGTCLCCWTLPFSSKTYREIQRDPLRDAMAGFDDETQ